MIVLVGVVILIAAVTVGVAGVVTNSAAAQSHSDHFELFGYHANTSPGIVFLAGIIVGAVGLWALHLLLSDIRMAGRHRRELWRSRREAAAAARDRDKLAVKHQKLLLRQARSTPDSPAAEPTAASSSSAFKGLKLPKLSKLSGKSEPAEQTV